MIQSFEPDIGGDTAAVSEAPRSGWVGLGPKAGEHVGATRRIRAS